MAGLETTLTVVALLHATVVFVVMWCVDDVIRPGKPPSSYVMGEDSPENRGLFRWNV